jgi:hypothetical protein
MAWLPETISKWILQKKKHLTMGTLLPLFGAIG